MHSPLLKTINFRWLRQAISAIRHPNQPPRHDHFGRPRRNAVTGKGIRVWGSMGRGSPVLVAEPVRWEVEVRCFVKDGAVLTMSPYLRHGELARAEDGGWPMTSAEADAVHACAERLFAEVPTPPAVVVDIGPIEGRGWAVVEANSAYGAGVYDCDPHRVLDVLARGCVPRTTLSCRSGHSDCDWESERFDRRPQRGSTRGPVGCVCCVGCRVALGCPPAGRGRVRASGRAQCGVKSSADAAVRDVDIDTSASSSPDIEEADHKGRFEGLTPGVRGPFRMPQWVPHHSEKDVGQLL
ncbi:ATP-grasp domain-containing protein [Nocardia sp. NPDC101769]|uniref:ATP-grasp domain-containing protein n=1 Tax=Nocardia sp. NPDC101769 TaxID=3364333 RepID=UPI00382FEA39